MVHDRKEPTISSIKPDSDEIATHQTRKTAAPQRPPAPGNARPSAPSRPQSPAKSASGTFGMILAVIALSVAGFSVWQWQVAKQAMVSAEARIVELEGRLNLSNSESDQSVTAIHDKLVWADSEIRKLWGVAHDTNRKAIAANTDQIAKVSKDASAAAAAAKAAKQSSDSQQTDLSAVKALTNEQQLILSQLSDDIASARRELKQLADASKQAEAQAKNVADLQKRLATNEEAITAIDSFRRSANADIQQIKQQLATP